MTECESCGNENTSDSGVCPHCGTMRENSKTPNISSKVPSVPRKYLYSILAILILVLGIGGAVFFIGIDTIVEQVQNLM